MTTKCNEYAGLNLGMKEDSSANTGEIQVKVWSVVHSKVPVMVF